MNLKSTCLLPVQLATAIAAMLATQNTRANPFYYEGNNSQTWNSSASWTTNPAAADIDGARPTSTHDVIFHMNGKNANINMSLVNTQAAKSITYRSTGTLNIAPNSSSSTGNKTLTIGAGGITKTVGSGLLSFNGPASTTGTVGVAVGASQTWTNNSTVGALDIGTTFSTGTNTAGTIGLGANTLTLAGGGNFNFGTAATTNSVIGISANSTLIKDGAGTLTIGGNNDFAGAITLNEGNVTLLTNGASGTSAGGIAVSGTAAATLQINAGITTADDITFSNTNATSSVKRNIAASGAYTTGTSGSLKSSFAGGTPDTTAQILAGTNSSLSESTLTMSFAESSAATNDFIRRSDIFTTSGTGTDSYVLSILAAGGLASDSFLARLDDSSNTWIAAGSTFFTAAYDSMTHGVGAYGFDSTNNSVWAVVNYGGSFAAVPEPTSALAGLLLGAGLLRRKRNIERRNLN